MNHQVDSQVVAGLERLDDFYVSIYEGIFIIPSDFPHIFSEGMGQPPTSFHGDLVMIKWRD